MQLHAGTLFVATALSSAVISGLLLLSWVQDRQTRALLWWSAGFFGIGVGLTLFIGGGERAAALPREIGNAIFLMSYGASYAASRRFNGASASWAAVFVGAVVWLSAVWLALIDFQARIVLSSCLLGSYAWATAFELWRGERLLFQRAAAIASAFQGSFLFLRAVMGAGMALLDESVDGSWAAFMGIEALLFVSVFGFTIMAMAKERVDLANRRAALVDPLTGASNRRGFMQDAARILDESERRNEPVSVLVFDLDHFKAINDRFGHKMGDDTLVEFSNIVRRELPHGGLFGRTGGEEFVVAVAGMTSGRALDLADRIRRRFASDSRLAVEHGSPATASAGVAAATAGTIDSLLSQADAALYRAKAAGRNRVVAAHGSDDRARLPLEQLAG